MCRHSRSSAIAPHWLLTSPPTPSTLPGPPHRAGRNEKAETNGICWSRAAPAAVSSTDRDGGARPESTAEESWLSGQPRCPQQICPGRVSGRDTSHPASHSSPCPSLLLQPTAKSESYSTLNSFSVIQVCFCCLQLRMLTARARTHTHTCINGVCVHIYILYTTYILYYMACFFPILP